MYFTRERGGVWCARGVRRWLDGGRARRETTPMAARWPQAGAARPWSRPWRLASRFEPRAGRWRSAPPGPRLTAARCGRGGDRRARRCASRCVESCGARARRLSQLTKTHTQSQRRVTNTYIPHVVESTTRVVARLEPGAGRPHMTPINTRQAGAAPRRVTTTRPAAPGAGYHQTQHTPHAAHQIKHHLPRKDRQHTYVQSTAADTPSVQTCVPTAAENIPELEARIGRKSLAAQLHPSSSAKGDARHAAGWSGDPR